MSAKIIKFHSLPPRPLNAPDIGDVGETEVFRLANGTVTISSKTGEELTLSSALFFLKMVEAYIIELAKK